LQTTAAHIHRQFSRLHRLIHCNAVTSATDIAYDTQEAIFGSSQMMTLSRGGNLQFLVRTFFAALMFCLAASPRPVSAAYPERPITMIVPFPPGGPTDIIARIVANALSQSLGQQVVVDNRSGAAGNIGMGQAARAAPDGYTILCTSTAIAVNPALFKNLPYDPFKDFAPVTELVNAPNVLVVRPDSGINTLADLIAKAKAAPGTFNYASPGAGTKSHLTGELLKIRADIQMQHVPYRGAGPAVQAVLSRTVQLGSVALAAAESLIKSGELRALAVTGESRWFSLPEVPTMIESGFPGFVSDTFNALFVPAKTSPDIVARLVKESRAAMQRADVREQVRRAGFEIVAGTPDQLAARLAAEIPSVRELVARAGIKPE
jgi:tripartite-type tricarboxylate transporter receptor subunit TctC